MVLDDQMHLPEMKWLREAYPEGTAAIRSNSRDVHLGRVRQCGVNSGLASGRHFQAAFGVICSG
jgi:hypothetical protein